MRPASARLLIGIGWLLLTAAPAAAATLPTGFQESVVFSGLTNPTAVRFAADGRVFVAEKSGLIKVFPSLSATAPTVFADLSTSVMNYWDRGLLGLALHPAFPSTPYVYVLYTLDAPIGGTPPVWNDACPTPPGPTTGGCVVGARLSRLQASGSTVMPGSEQVLIENWCQQFPSHSIGDLVFGADGALYVSAGEGANFIQVDYGQSGSPQVNPCGDPPAGVGGTMAPPAALGGALRSQNLSTPGFPVTFDGKILRVDPLTGAAFPGNPLAGSGSGADRVIAEGFRNPFRFTVRPGTSELWIGDVGWNDWEEIDRLTAPPPAVADFGWPCYEGPAPQSSYASTGLDACTNLYAAGTAVAPFFSYNHADQVVPGETCPSGSSSISGLAFYGTGTYPATYANALFFSDYSRNCIWAMFPNGTGQPDPSTRITFAAGAPGPVDLEIGPGGDLYYVDFNGGTVRRIQYVGPAPPPVAVATADVTSGPAPLTVHFDASGSTDPIPGDALTYSWDLDGNGQYGDSTSVAPTYTYAAAGVYTVGLRVTDGQGATGSTTLTITVDGAPPVPTITAPAPGTAWSVGDVIAFAGSASDAQDGPLPPSALSWSIVLHHCPSTCHTHLIQNFPGVAGGSFAAPDHDYPSYIELRLTATDSLGLVGTASLDLFPSTVDLTIASTPPGLSVAFGSGTDATPFTRTVIVGSSNSLAVASPQTLAGVPYDFIAWSDGGAQAHDVVASASPATYTATFVRTCPGTCGDGVVQAPCEQCDLGESNCRPGQLCDSGCTADCHL